MIDKDKAYTDFAWMKSILQKRDQKYIRNYNRYFNNGIRRESINSVYGQPHGFYFNSSEQDTGIIPAVNILKSCVDSSISKLSQTKVRPFFNPLQGTYKTIQAARATQVYMDQAFDKLSIYKLGIMATRDAEIFEYGVLHINAETKTVERIFPWQFYFDPAEFTYDKITRCAIERHWYPIYSLSDKIKNFPLLTKKLEEAPAATCYYVIYYNLRDKLKYEYADGECIKTTPLESSEIPFEYIYYNDPVKGPFSISMIDNLYSIQTEIDTLTNIIHTATLLNPANTIFIQSGADIKRSNFSNQIGAMYEYVAQDTAGSPVTVSTPRPMDPAYIQLFNMWETKAYEIEGISQLSAQSKKPAGITAGVALDTLQDVESERHQVILNNVIKLYMGIAKKMINIFPSNEDILPKRLGRASIKWSQIKQQVDSLDIQFSASSSLSKDPETKMKQIEKLIAMNFINKSVAANLLEFPDLEDAYSIMTASYDNCQKIIQRAIEDEEYDYYEVVDINQLYGEIVGTILRLDANDEDPKVIAHLVTLLTKVKAQMDAMTAANAPPPMTPAPNGPPAPGAIPMANVPGMQAPTMEVGPVSTRAKGVSNLPIGG